MAHSCKAMNDVEDEGIYDALQRSNGCSELFIAVSKCDFRTLRARIQSGADLNRPESTCGRPIIYAVILSANARMVGELIRAGADPNIKPKKQMRPLEFAVLLGHLEVIETLLDHGADIHVKMSKRGWTALHAAVGFGDVKIAKLLIERGLDVNASTKDGKTALHVAAGCDKPQMVRMLISKGADISATASKAFDKDKSCNGKVKEKCSMELGSGITPLLLAAYSGRTDVVDILIKAGIDVNVKTTENFTVLHLPAQNGPLELVNLLLEAGAGSSVNVASNYKGYTPLLLAAKAGQTDIVEALLKVEGIEVNPTSVSTVTPLVVAASNGHLKIVELLLAKGAPVDGRTFNAMTPLHIALNAKKEDIANILLKQGADIHAVDATNATPLHKACDKGISLTTIKTLVVKGANINARTNDNTTPLHIALAAKQNDIAEVLMKQGADIHAVDATNATPLHKACTKGVSLKIIKILVEKGANVNVTTNDGMTPLHCAVAGNHFEVVKYLIDCRADCNAVQSENWTPLHYAAGIGSAETVEYLVTKGANIDAVSSALTTPLHCAVEKGHQEVVKILVKSRANVNAQDVNKRTLLHIALHKGHVEIAEILLKYNALVNLKEEEDGCSPLFLAVKYNYGKLVSLLLDKGADVNAANKFGVLPIHVAVKADNLSIVESLLAKGAYYNVKAKAQDYSGTPLEFARTVGNAKIIIILEIIKRLFCAAIRNDLDQLILCIQAGAIINARKIKGLTALHCAVNNYNSDAVKALLAGGANITLVTDEGDSPLQVAIANGCITIPEILLAHAKKLSFVDYNAVVDAKTVKSGNTVLHTAAESNKLHIVKFLLANGAIYNAKNNVGKTPRELATLQEIKSLLTSAEELFKAVWKEDGLEDVMRILTENSSLLNVREIGWGGTPLLWSIAEGHMDIAHALLSKSADVCLLTNDGSTSLQVAAYEGDVQIVEALVNRLKNDNAERAHDFIDAVSNGAALHVASNLEVALCLLQAGATYNIRNEEGETVWESKSILVQRVNSGVRKLLKMANRLFEGTEKGVFKDTIWNNLTTEERKAVLSSRNEKGQTLAQVAQANGHLNIANKLLKRLR